ncbi:hypothetical protein Tco_0166951, partial [Tanacetum coccineum]
QGSTVEDDVVKAKEKMHIAASPNETEKNVTGCEFQRQTMHSTGQTRACSYSSGAAH